MGQLIRLLTVAACCIAVFGCGSPAGGEPTNALVLPPAGYAELRALTPQLLELTLVSEKRTSTSSPGGWKFTGGKLPDGNEFLVTASGRTLSVKGVGYRRRVLYAPFKKRDLRIGNYLYLQLAAPIKENETVSVRCAGQALWPESLRFETILTPARISPVLHVNQTGYVPSLPKLAMAGYFLGTLGELQWQGLSNTFRIVAVDSGKEVFSGHLTPRRDRGFTFPQYEQVLQADFSDLRTPGEYQLEVSGLGRSFPFWVSEGTAAVFARTYALGLYHQRCGVANALPYTRFIHDSCHTKPAEVPTMAHKFDSVNESLAKESANYKDNPRHTAPQLKSVAASLYPFVNKGPVDVHGGHHDAGDYSKYTANSAGFIHLLLFAADVFPGAGELDNLGLPESGDGKGDLYQEVKWEADFLARMQDADGGFYFLVYPRDREYEFDVTPDHGDPQVVFPKTTSVTAAATAALAQCASSPRFKALFPEAAADYLAKARKGWEFLERAIAAHGLEGSYQKFTHYGDEFMADDELAWAACELFLATGEKQFEDKLAEWLKPDDPNTRKWGWLRLYEAYGCAIRSYAFAAKSGRVPREKLDPMLLGKCEDEIIATGEEQLRRADSSAYGTSFPLETKRVGTAGWYFSSDAAFDLATACQIDYPRLRDPRPKLMAALLSNLNYEQGCNPVNIVYLTGLGWKRQREIVHQYAQNDRRVLPPTGIPLGNIQGGFGWLDAYKKEPTDLSVPPDETAPGSYPFYDRWSDAFNLTQEFVILQQARALGYTAWLMAQTSLKSQPWRAATGKIVADQNGYALTAEAGVDLAGARTVWESSSGQLGNERTFSPAGARPAWVEAEAQLPDGRRIFGVSDASAARH